MDELAAPQMDPNSVHQIWSFWLYRIYPEKQPAFALVRDNCARFGRLIFGSATEMKVIEAIDRKGYPYFEIAIRAEGHPVHESAYTDWMHLQWDKFFRNGFGQECIVNSHAHLEAGSRQDGTPADQLIMMPPRIEMDWSI
jgi:hypothetical protein